jgi:hypothetical protein
VQKLTVNVNGADTEIDVAFESMTLKEQVLFQKTIGTSRYHEWDGASLEPDILHGLIFVGVHRVHPEVGVDDFDLPSEEVIRWLNIPAEVEENPTSGS